MQQLTHTIQRITLATLAALLLVVPSIVPMSAYAATPTTPDCFSAPAPKGVYGPIGSDAKTFKYNSCEGYWENLYYKWIPNSNNPTLKAQPTYNYNVKTGKCDAKIPQWSPATSSWYFSTSSVTTPPNDAACVGKPAPLPPTPATPSANATSQAAVAAAGPNAAGSSIDTSSKNNQTVNDNTNATLNNNINSQAGSGNALAVGNVGIIGSTGGAASGNAQAIANVFNLLQSTSTMGANVATFVANIDGDVQGDLIVDPSALQPADNSTSFDNNVDVNVNNNGSINNNITLAAKSGDATVAKNVNAGDATSGNAQAIANVVNMMNSLVSANQSFLGIININGNLNGNILMPQNFLDSLIASNAPHENVNVSQDTINKLSGTVTNDQATTNNVKNSATSGDASATKNVNSGALSGATSGSAQTNVTIFNLTNDQVVGGNSMLVFVNVLGKWVGVIMDAPAGATAAALGGGVTSASKVNNNANYDINNKGTITNNIDVSAASGDASVTKNVNAGDAKSGDAATAVNLANITNSTVNLTGWFGILFINVFGNWNGNFGVMTAVPSATSGLSGGGGGAGQSSSQPFGFAPTGATAASAATPYSATAGRSSNVGSNSGSSASFSDNDIASVANKVLGSHIARTPATLVNSQAVQHDHNVAFIAGAALFFGGILLAGVDQIRSRR